MVFLILTATGAADVLASVCRDGNALWINAGLPLSVNELRGEGWNISQLSHSVDPLDRSAIDDVVCTMLEHHPCEVIVVEAVPAHEAR